MTPYLVHKTWVDLDHVLAIGSEVIHIDHISCGSGWLCAFSVPVTFMFGDERNQISLADGGRDLTSEEQKAILFVARMELSKFLAAWKTRPVVNPAWIHPP